MADGVKCWDEKVDLSVMSYPICIEVVECFFLLDFFLFGFWNISRLGCVVNAKMLIQFNFLAAIFEQFILYRTVLCCCCVLYSLLPYYGLFARTFSLMSFSMLCWRWCFHFGNSYITKSNNPFASEMVLSNKPNEWGLWDV